MLGPPALRLASLQLALQFHISPALRRARLALHLKAAYIFPSSSSLPETRQET